MTSIPSAKAVETAASACRVIVDQIDPSNLVPGGTDTCIHDLVKYSAEPGLAIVGITSDPQVRVGTWTITTMANRAIAFMPVARMDRTRSGSKVRIPDSLKLAIGIMRFKGKIPDVPLQAHRIEIGAVLLMFFKRADIYQYIHNGSAGLTGSNSDSIWKHASRAYRGIEKFVFKRAALIVLFSKTDSTRVLNMRKDARIVETWFDPEIFHPNLDDRRRRKISVLYVGRLESQKDPLLAVRAFAMSKALRPELTMTVVGSGTLLSAMEDLARELEVRDSIEFMGSLDRSTVAGLMRSAGVLILTSHYEGSPRVVAESCACGLAIVATAGADTDLVLDGNTTGIRVEARDAKIISLALAEVLQWGSSEMTIADAVKHRNAASLIGSLLGDNGSTVEEVL